jgi:hypothetical protein
MHPSNRAERRQERERVIARRKFIHDHIWFQSQHHTDPTVMPWAQHPPFSEFGRYAKFNLSCGCMGCHCAKHWYKDRRRRALKVSDSVADHRKRDKVAGK